jgi:hypothetical protein
MKRIILVLLAVFVFSVLAAGNIKVVVLDANDVPIEGALVMIEYKGELTDSSGVAILNGIYETSQVSMRVSKDGYLPYETQFMAKDNMIINVRLYSNTVGYIRGMLYIGDSDHPANKDIIEIYDSKSGEKIDTFVTDEQGRFSYATSVDRKCFLIVRGYEQRFEVTPTADPAAGGLSLIVAVTPPQTPEPSRALVASNIEFLPGFLVVRGRMAATADTESSYDARKAIDFWYRDTPTRFQIFSDSLHHSFTLSYNAARPEVVSGIGYVDLTTDDALNSKKAFLIVSVGGPQVNVHTRFLNETLRVKFVPDEASVDRWHILDTQNNYSFTASTMGIITFLPNPAYLDDIVGARVKGGDKRIGTLILAGNAREGTEAAVLKFNEFLRGSTEGAAFLENFDKMLLWLYTGENQQIQQITFVVEYVSPTQARVLGIIVG